jgi:hypothetical protein
MDSSGPQSLERGSTDELGGRHICNRGGLRKTFRKPPAARKLISPGRWREISTTAFFMRPPLCAVPGDAMTVGYDTGRALSAAKSTSLPIIRQAAAVMRLPVG